MGLGIHSCMSCKSIIFVFHKFVDTLYGIPTFHLYFIMREGKKNSGKEYVLGIFNSFLGQILMHIPIGFLELLT